jgi:hypothetical protein
MKIKIVLILLIFSLIIGCIEKPIESKNIIPETYEDITNKFKNECGNTLTTAQCDDWVENHINGNYVRWNGEVKDVRNEIVYVRIIDGKSFDAFRPFGIGLHDINKEELMKLKPKENIRFTGKINIEKHPTTGSYYDSWLDGLYGFNDLYEVTVEITPTTIPTKNPCLISESPPYPNGWTKEQVKEFNERIKDQPCQKVGI